MQRNTLVAPEDGAHFDLGGGVGVTIKITGESTGGCFAVVEHPVEPGGLVEPHTHTKEDEYSYVLEGEIGIQIGEEVLTAPTGSIVYKPRGLEHAFWNAGPAPARILEIISPAGFEHFFRETVGLVAPDGTFDERGFVELAERYGMSFAFEKAPELVEKHNLTRNP